MAKGTSGFSNFYGKTRTIDHHNELIQMGISPSLKGTQVAHKFPYVIYRAPPYQNSDYPGDVREATLNWNGEGSFVLLQVLLLMIAVIMDLVMRILQWYQ